VKLTLTDLYKLGVMVHSSKGYKGMEVDNAYIALGVKNAS